MNASSTKSRSPILPAEGFIFNVSGVTETGLAGRALQWGAARDVRRSRPECRGSATGFELSKTTSETSPRAPSRRDTTASFGRRTT